MEYYRRYPHLVLSHLSSRVESDRFVELSSMGCSTMNRAVQISFQIKLCRSRGSSAHALNLASYSKSLGIWYHVEAGDDRMLTAIMQDTCLIY